MSAESAALHESQPGAPLLLGVQAGYERWAPTYDEAPNPILAREERYVLSVLPSLSGKSVLDLACGTGRWLEKALARGAKTGAGIDFSEAMLNVARAKTAIQSKLARAHCGELPFGSESFDVGICSFALGHFRDLRSVARELGRVMKPGADVFVTDLHPEAYGRGWRTGFRDARAAVQIENRPRTPEEILLSFYAGAFECLTYVSLCMGKPERPLFVTAKRERMFEEICRVPAVLFCRFKRR